MIVFTKGGILVICMMIMKRGINIFKKSDFNHEVNNFGVGSEGVFFSLIKLTAIAGDRSLGSSWWKIYSADENDIYSWKRIEINWN